MPGGRRGVGDRDFPSTGTYVGVGGYGCALRTTCNSAPAGPGQHPNVIDSLYGNTQRQKQRSCGAHTRAVSGAVLQNGVLRFASPSSRTVASTTQTSLAFTERLSMQCSAVQCSSMSALLNDRVCCAVQCSVSAFERHGVVLVWDDF